MCLKKFERADCICKIRPMKIIRPFLALFLFSFFTVYQTQAQSEAIKEGNLLYVKLGNGMNAVLMPITNASDIEISFYIKAGSIFEIDSLSGISNLLQQILSNKVDRFLQRGSGSISGANTKFKAVSNTERTIFKLTTNSDNLGYCFNLLRDSVFNSTITESELMDAKKAVENKIELARKDKHMLFEARLTKSIYRQDYQKMDVYGDAKDFKNITVSVLVGFFHKYYVPNNTIVTATGNFSFAVVQQQLESAFNSMVKAEFNPETVTKIVDFKPMVYNTQFIVEDSIANPEFHICWQFTGAAANEKASHCAHLLTTMLNDKNNFIQVKAAKMNCRKLVADYQSNNFSGVLRVVVQPDKQNWFNTYSFVVKELTRLDQTLANESMLIAAKVQFKKGYEFLKNTKEYPQQLVKYWVDNDETYFPGLEDSIMDVREIDMKDFVSFYMNRNPYVTGLLINEHDRNELNVDSLFTELNDSVKNYVFTYHQNITDLTTKEDSIQLRNLLQWLRINPDVNMQINGYSDESEFGKTFDDSVMMFIDSMPAFKRTMPEVVKKRYLRPEMMRTMKLVKYFYEQGIAPERLSGTSMKFSSATKQEAIDNAKCTITLNKQRKLPSLYELHYGKKKE